MNNISKYKKFDDDFKKNNELWQVTLDAMSESVFLIDNDYKILTCNKATLNFLEKSNFDEIIGHYCWDLVHGTSEPIEWCPLSRMRQSRHRETTVQKLKNRWVEISVEPVINNNGKITGIIHIIKDIDARKKVEESLRESEQQYLTILNSLTDAMHVVDRDLRIIYQNPAMIHWLEKLNLGSDIIGNTIFEAFPFLDYEKVYNEYVKVFRDEKFLISTEVTKLSTRKVFTETLKIPIVREGQVIQIITILRDITYQKEAEETYKNIVNQLLDIIIILDLNGNFEYVSPQAFEIVGYKPEEIIGKSGFKFMHPDDLKKAATVLREAIKNKKSVYLEYRTIHKDGYYINVSANGRIVSMDGEEKVFAVVRDISDQKRAEQKLIESEKKFRNLFENSPNMLMLLNKDGIILDVNQLFLKSFSYERLELIGENFQNIQRFDSKNLSLLIEKYNEIIEKGKVDPFVLKTKNKEGITLWFNLQASSIEIGDRQYIQVIFQDITEKVLADHELKESEEKYRLITENANDMIAILNSKIEYEYVNESAFQNIMGRTSDMLLGGNALRWVHPDDLNLCMDAFKQGWKKGEASIHARFKDVNDKYHWLDIRGKRIINHKGEEKVLIVSRDISERKTYEEKLKISEEKYRYLIENAMEGVWVIDSNANTILVNPSMAKILGYSVDEMIGESLFSFMDKEEVENTKKHLEKRKKGISEERDAIFTHKNSNKVYLRIRGTPIFSSKGEYEGTYAFLADITKRKLAEQKLKESEELFRTIAEQSFMGIIILQDGVFKYFNEQAANINGYTIEEIQNWKPNEFKKIIYPDDREFVMEQAQKKQRGDLDVRSHYRYRIIKKNGDVIWVENFSKTINYGGKAADFVMTIDINDKIKAEHKLLESEEKYRLISENTDDLIVVYSEDGIIEYLNAETHSRVLGYNSDKFLDKVFRDAIVHPEDKIEADLSGNEGIERGYFQYQFRLKHISGDYLWFEVTGKEFEDHHGNKKILCVSRKINEKKIAEQKIKESEENFRTIAEQAFIGTLIIQEDKVEYVNNALLQIFEYTNEEINNWKKDDLIKLIYPDDLQYLREYRKRLRSGESDIKQYYSYRVFTKYGKIKWIDQYSRPIIYKGKPAELITIMDITEKKKAEEELKKLNSLKSELLRRTSHELKTPLVSIKGFSDLLLTVHKEKLDDYVLATIHEIKLGCERLENLIQDILKTAELESELVELKKSEEDLSFLIKLCVKELKGLIRLRNHEIVLDIHDRLITKVEPDQMHLVISNLLNNAIKYTPPNGKIEIRTAITDESILISVHDNGIGITNEEKKRLFTQFGKIERYGQGLDIISEGSGLGLFITKKIIELHAGRIWVKSKGRNKGTTFYFTIPLIK